jgi:hypothetical protein
VQTSSARLHFYLYIHRYILLILYFPQREKKGKKRLEARLTTPTVSSFPGAAALRSAQRVASPHPLRC